MRAFFAYSATVSGSRWALITRISWRMPRSSSSAAAFSITGMSLFEPITMPTWGAVVDVEVVELVLDLGLGHRRQRC